MVWNIHRRCFSRYLTCTIVLILCFFTLNFFNEKSKNKVAHLSSYDEHVHEKSKKIVANPSSYDEHVHEKSKKIVAHPSSYDEIVHEKKFSKHRINCESILSNNTAEIEKAVKTKWRISRNVSLDQYDVWTSNCTNFIHERDYWSESISTEESNFPIAFTIITYKDAQQTERLLRAIYRPHNFYCIHVDKKSSLKLKNTIKRIAACFTNVVVPDLYDVKWGGITHVYAEQSCMKSLLNYTKWKYVINLTGQEFPLMTNLELVRFIKSKNGLNIISGSANKKWLFRIGKMYKNHTLKVPIPHRLNFTKGSNHWALTREFASYSVNDPIAKELLKYLNKSYLPEESFFNILAYSPEIVSATIGTSLTEFDLSEEVRQPEPMRFKIWKWHKIKELVCPGGKWQRDICMIGIREISFLRESRKPFVNKFLYEYEPLGYDCLELVLYHKARYGIDWKS